MHRRKNWQGLPLSQLFAACKYSDAPELFSMYCCFFKRCAATCGKWRWAAQDLEANAEELQSLRAQLTLAKQSAPTPSVLIAEFLANRQQSTNKRAPKFTPVFFCRVLAFVFRIARRLKPLDAAQDRLVFHIAGLRPIRPLGSFGPHQIRALAERLLDGVGKGDQQ